MVRARGAGSSTDRPTLLLALLGYYNPKDDGQGIGRGGGGGHRRGTEISISQQEGRDQRSEGARSDHENTLPLGGRVLGHLRLYGEGGRGEGGEDKETGTTRIDEGPRASTKKH